MVLGELLGGLGSSSVGSLCAWLILGLCAWLPVELAAAQGVQLRWERPAGSQCIRQEQLARDVSELFEQEGAAARTLAMEGQVALIGRRWVASVSAFSEAGARLGTRVLQGDEDAECSQLDRALVVVIATLLDMALRAPAAPPRAAAAAVSGGWSLALGASAAVDLGSLPRLAPGLAVSVLVDAPGRWPTLVLGGSYWLSSEAARADQRGVRVTAYQLGLSACPRVLGRQPLALALCAGAAAGGMRAEGLGVDQARAQTRLTAALVLETALSFPLVGPLSGRLSAGAALGLVRPRFYVSDADGLRHDLHRAHWISAFAQIGIIARLL